MAMNLGTATARITLDASDLLANSARAQQALQNLDRSVSGTLDRTGRAMINTGAMLTRRVTVPLTLAGGYMLKTAGDFEAGMNKVLAITDATGAQFDLLRGQAIDLSRTTKFTANEVADGMSFLAMAGFEVNEIYAAMPGMLDLAAAGNLDLARSADIVSNIMQGMGIEASETTRVVDVLTSAFTGSNVTVEMLGDSFRYVATAARQAGWDIEQTTAVLGLLGNAGIQASMAGTSVRNWIVRLTAQTPKATKALEALGVETHNLDGSLKSPLDLVREFEGAMDRWGVSIDGLDIDNLTSQFEGMEEAVLATGMSLEDFDAMEFADQLDYLNAIGYDTSAMMDSAGNSAEFLAAIFDIFGLRGAPAFLALLQQGSAELETFTDRLYNAAGTAARVAETMMKGLNGALLILKSAWEAWMIQLGDAGALEFATRAVQGLTRGIEFLSEMSDASRRRLLLFLGAAMALGPGLVILGAGLRAVAFLMRTLGFSSILGNLVRLSPLLAAAGLGFLAWRNNLFGIQTIVRRLTPALRQFGRVWSETFGRSRDQGDTVMVAALKATGNALVSIAPLFGRFGETVRDVGLWFREAARTTEYLTGRFQYFRRLGLDPLNAALVAVGQTFPSLADEMQAAQRIVNDFTASWQRFRDIGLGPVGAALMAIGTEFPALRAAMAGLFNIVDGLGTAFQAALRGDWAGAFAGLEQAARGAWGVIQEVAGGISGLVVNLWDWTINTGVPAVTGWIADNAGDIGRAILDAAGWVWDNIIAPIPGVVLDILDWFITSGVSIWNKIASYVLGGGGVESAGMLAGAGASGGGIPVGPVLLRIVDWIITEARNAWNAIAEWVLRGAGPGGLGTRMGATAGGGGIPIGPVAIAITEWEIVADIGDMWQSLSQWLDEQFTVTEADVAAWEPKGREIGASIMRRIIDGIKGAFSDGPSVGAGSGDGGPSELHEQLWAYLEPILEGAWDELQPELENWGTQIKRRMQLWWNSWAPTLLQFDTLAGSPVQQSADRTAGGLLNAVAGPTFFEKLKEDIQGKWEDFTGWIDGFDFSISMPSIDIDWPDMPEPPSWMTTAPQWWTNMQEGRFPWDDGGSVGGAAGSTGASGGFFDIQKRIDDAFETIRKVQEAARRLGVSASPSGGWGGPRTGPLPGLGIFAGIIPTADAVGRAARAAFSGVPAAINAAMSAIGGTDVTLTVTADTGQATAALGETVGQMAALDGQSSTVQVLGENAGALAAVAGAESALGGIAGRTAQTYVNGDNSNALGAILGAAAALAGFDGTTGTAYLNAIDNVSGAVSSALAAVRSLDGATATAYINVVSSGTGIGGRIPGFASGGYVNSPYAIVGEEGPELVSLPYGSYVHTAAETAAMLAQARATPYYGSTGGGSSTITHTTVIDFSGASFHNTSRDEMNQWAANDLMPMFERAKQRRDLAKGVAR